MATAISLSSASVIAILYMLARRGLESQAPQIAVALLAFIAFAGCLRLAGRRRLLGLDPDLQIPIAAVALFAGLAIGSLFAPLTWAALAVAVIGFVGRPSKRALLTACPLCLFGGVVGGALFLWANAPRYASIYTTELALLGAANKDTLYHADLTTMLRGYGVISTGLSGLRPTFYYVGSHAVMAGLSSLSNVLPLWQYPAGQQLLFLPCLVFSYAYAAARFVEAEASIVAVSSMTVLLATTMFSWSDYLISESFAVSMSIFLLSLPALIFLLKAESRLDRRSVLSWCATIAIILAALLVTKASTAIIAAVIAGLSLLARVLRHRFKLLRFALLAIMIGAVAAIVVATKVLAYPLQPFAFWIQYPQQFTIDAVLVLSGIGALVILPPLRGLEQRREIALVMGVAAVAGFLPGLLVDIAGGSAAYFQAPAAIVMCVFIGGAIARAGIHALNLWRLQLSAKLIATIGAAFVALTTLIDRSPAGNGLAGLIELSRLLHAPYKASPSDLYAPQPDFTSNSSIFQVGELFKAFDPRVERFIAESYLSKLHRAAAADARPRESLFAPPDARVYWASHADCTAAPFVGPALTGQPMILGLPPLRQECELDNYGYTFYRTADHSRNVAAPDLCRLVVQSGFMSVTILPDSANKEFRKMNCGATATRD